MEDKSLSAHSELVTLVLNWAALMALSLILAFSADIGGAARPGAVWIFVIAGAAAFKSRIVALLSRPRQGARRARRLFHRRPGAAGVGRRVFRDFPDAQILPTPKAASGPQAVQNSLIHTRSN